MPFGPTHLALYLKRNSGSVKGTEELPGQQGKTWFILWRSRIHGMSTPGHALYEVLGLNVDKYEPCLVDLTV